MKLINGEFWEVKKINDDGIAIYGVINTHQRDGMQSGATSPDTVKYFLSKEKADYFLNEIDNELRNVILSIGEKEFITIELIDKIKYPNPISGIVTNNSRSLAISDSENNFDLDIEYSDIKSIKRN